MPTVASAVALDIPQDFEDVFIAAAKAHFLADHADQSERQRFWAGEAARGFAEMRADEAFVPDELITFEPPSYGIYTNYDPGSYPQWEWGTW